MTNAGIEADVASLGLACAIAQAAGHDHHPEPKFDLMLFQQKEGKWGCLLYRNDFTPSQSIRPRLMVSTIKNNELTYPEENKDKIIALMKDVVKGYNWDPDDPLHLKIHESRHSDA